MCFKKKVIGLALVCLGLGIPAIAFLGFFAYFTAVALIMAGLWLLLFC